MLEDLEPLPRHTITKRVVTKELILRELNDIIEKREYQSESEYDENPLYNVSDKLISSFKQVLDEAEKQGKNLYQQEFQDMLDVLGAITDTVSDIEYMGDKYEHEYHSPEAKLSYAMEFKSDDGRNE